MRKTLIRCLLMLTILWPLVLSGQSIQVSDPRLEMKGNTIHIFYDILNSTPSDKFTVELRVKDENGNLINAAALSGDVGDTVTGGSDKQIAWDLDVDHIEMNADIIVKVYVKAIPPPEPVVLAPPSKEVEALNEGQFSRTGLLLQSVAFPGLGLYRYKGGPHWIRGILGYGCLAGSIVMNRVAVHTYDGIIDLAGYDAKNAEYQKSLSQDQVSEALAYTAIAIWVSDLVWTIAGTSDLNRKAALNGGIRIDPLIDPVSLAPMLALTLQF